MNQIQLIETPLTDDEQMMLDRMKSWVPSGIGAIRFDDLTFQLGWGRKRAAHAFQELIERGLICGPGHIGEYFVTEAKQ